jgi:hypothetical protein
VYKKNKFWILALKICIRYFKNEFETKGNSIPLSLRLRRIRGKIVSPPIMAQSKIFFSKP